MSTTVTSTQITGMDLGAYLTSDPARSIAFYRDVLGMEPTNETPGRGAEFTLADGQTFGVWKLDGGATSGGAIMFAVADAKAAVERFRSNGADIQRRARDAGVLHGAGRRSRRQRFHHPPAQVGPLNTGVARAAHCYEVRCTARARRDHITVSPSCSSMRVPVRAKPFFSSTRADATFATTVSATTT